MMNTLNCASRVRRVAILLALISSVAADKTLGFDEPNTTGVKSPRPRTAAVERGNIDLSIRAIGTIEPEEVVDVNALVSGAITRFGDDPAQPDHRISWNSKVEAGTVLAYIDDSSYKTARDIARINLKKSRAVVRGAQIAVDKASAEYERDKVMLAKQAIAQADFDAAKFALETTKSNLEVADAQAELDETALKQAETNLENTRIKSPVKGTVIDRRFNVGQIVGATVAENANSPSLFLIAKDLSKLQIWLSINEADIGQIHKGQTMRFAVEAVPNKIFEGRVDEVRLNATMANNVVTYTAVISTDNSNGELLPYETATATISAGRHKDVLMVPNAALSFTPSQFYSLKIPDKKNHGRVWIQDGKSIRPIDLKLGVTDGSMTEVVEGDIKEGTQVVVGTEP